MQTRRSNIDFIIITNAAFVIFVSVAVDGVVIVAVFVVGGCGYL